MNKAPKSTHKIAPKSYRKISVTGQSQNWAKIWLYIKQICFSDPFLKLRIKAQNNEDSKGKGSILGRKEGRVASNRDENGEVILLILTVCKS
jgi:hypothetical protein